MMAESSLPDQPEWSCGPDRLGGGTMPLVMGILNVTPDSFHDGRSTFRDLEGMIALGDELRAAGADIIDVGGESTRPGASRVPPEEQRLRTSGVIAGIRERCTTPISIDTTHRSVAEAALDAGATIVNDVSAGTEDPALLDLVAERGAGLVLMHRLTDPLRDSYSDRYESDPEYGAPGVVPAVAEHLRQRLDAAVARGVGPEQIVLDPGLGFGKSVPQNLDLVRGLPDLRAALGRPLLIGASRKSFIGALLGGQAPSERLPGSLAVALVAAQLGAFVLRTHDVAPTRETLLVAAEIHRPGTTSGGTI